MASYPVTGGLALLATGVTVAWAAEQVDVEAVVLDVRAFLGEPWRLVTSILPHVDIFHLLFNVYWLWVFGTLVEDVFGHARTLVVIGLFAMGSGAAEYALFADGGVGLSGVGYGLFGMTWWLSRRDPRFLGAVDRRTVGLFAGWFVLCIVLTVADWMPVANVAHGMGWAQGLVMGAWITARGSGPRLALTTLNLGLLVASLTGATVLRARLNLSSHSGRDSARLGYLALLAEDNAAAAAHLERAVRLNEDPGWWQNLGIAYDRLGRPQDAARAFGRAGHAQTPSTAGWRRSRPTGTTATDGTSTSG